MPAKKADPPQIAEEGRWPLAFESIQDKPWALLPGKLEEIAALIESRLAGEKFDFPEAARGKSGNQAGDRYQVQNGVAVVPVYGILDKRMNLFMEFSGGTSTQLLARDLRQALDDPQVEAILLDVESPGGSVDGTKEVADLVLGARSQGKPIVAFANGLMASAAYWIGSAAAAVVANETAQVGSIGVAMMHVDRSAQDAMLGLKRTAIFAGKYKRLASDEKPLSESGQAYLQDIVDDYYGIFLDAVARNRGVDAETAHKKMADGRIFIGKKALKAGLVDKIGTMEDALAMAKQMGGMQNMDLKTLKAQHPDVFVEAKAEGAAEMTLEAVLQRQPGAVEPFRIEGESRERARVMEILEANGDAAITVQAIKDGITPGAATKLLLKAEQEGRVKSLAALAAAAAPLVGQPESKVETVTDPEREDAPIETRAKAAWDKDPKLHKEFGGKFETYLAFFRADAQGQVIK